MPLLAQSRPNPGSLSRSKPATVGAGREVAGQPAPGLDEVGLDAVGVVVEVLPRVRHRRRELPLGDAAGRGAVGDRGPGGRAVPAVGGSAGAGAGDAVRRVDRETVGVLVHVEDDVQPVRRGPVDRLPDLVDVRRVVGARRRLERRPGHDQPDAVEAEVGDVAEVVLGQRDRRLVVGVRLVVLAELVHVHAAQQHLGAAPVADRRVVAPGRVQPREHLRLVALRRDGGSGRDDHEGRQERGGDGDETDHPGSVSQFRARSVRNWADLT